MATSRYDAIAEWYTEVFGDRVDDDPSAAVLELLGDVSGLRVCDLACGHGRIARELARRGAIVVGVDASSVLIETAQHRESDKPLGVTYVHADVCAPDALSGRTFDAVVCNLALPDIDDLEGALATVVRTLSTAGRFVASMPHPCFQCPDAHWVPARDTNPPGRLVAGYFEEGHWFSGPAPGQKGQEDAEALWMIPTGVRGRVGANHRMLSTYVNALSRAGLLIDHVIEPRTASPRFISEETISGYTRVPAFLIFSARHVT